MVRLLGVDLPRNKRIEYALTAIHGIGLSTAKKIILNVKIDSDRRTDDLTTEETIALRDSLEEINLKLEGDLRRFNGLNIKRLNDINCYRGRRHRTSLPLRGQRTRTNARTRRGPKKTVSGKKK
jgi:small subunit ribosomal protein S13|tara:strand:- start:294 stop:665 length:372 start_codon:yes stop_codon:yes gene_type:complete